MRNALCTTLLLVSIVGTYSPSSFAQTSTGKKSDDGTSTGQRIGNIISAAVSTAFPAVDKVLTAIWPKGTENQRKTQDQAKPAVQSAKDSADATQKTNLAKLTAAANNLAIARTFVTTCADVDVRIGVMRAMLSTKDTSKDLTKKEIEELQDWWNPANEALKELENQKLKDQVNSLDDDFLKSTFTGVQTAVQGLSGNITNQLTQGRSAALRASLDQLEPKLASISPLTAILIGDISNSLAKASDKISGAAGNEQDPAAANDRKSNLTLIDKLKNFNANNQ